MLTSIENVITPVVLRVWRSQMLQDPQAVLVSTENVITPVVLRVWRSQMLQDPQAVLTGCLSAVNEQNLLHSYQTVTAKVKSIWS